MKYLAVRITCRLLSDASFSAYKGSMLRGTLGSHLRRAVCMIQKNDCTQCLLGRTCIFPRLFTAASAPQGSGTAPLLPPPFCIVPTTDKKTLYEKGEFFSFTLKLFSYAVEYLPYFIHALTLAGQRGMGKGSEHGAGMFSIEEVRHGDDQLYDAHNEHLVPCTGQELEIPVLGEDMGTASLACHFITPLRFKAANHLSSELDFSTLFRLILRRIKSLSALEGQSYRLPDDMFSTIFQCADSIRVEENSLRWEDWSRYSGRQQAVMQFGGLTGRIVYRGPVRAFADYLDFAHHVHIGKQTSFGLGQCEFVL